MMQRHVASRGKGRAVAIARPLPLGWMAGLLGLALAALAAIPGHAANFTPPQGCQLQATVQNRGCSVSQYYSCKADPQGDQRNTD